jgi:ADP-heptose:LPS heptosyltransferase|tara:strand:- start:2281 stop:3270 length:990 start_codon:yes stop_codon:yes gene_type:complete
MKILILRFSSIGDIVLTTPIIRCLKLQIPEAEVHYLTKDKYTSLLKHNPYIDHLHCFADGEESLALEKLKVLSLDVIIDLHKNTRTKRIISQLSLPHYTFRKLNIKKWLFVNFKINLLPKKHIVDRYFDGIASLNVKNDNNGLDFFTSTSAKKSEALADLPSEYYTLAVGGTYFTKQITRTLILSIFKRLNKRIVLLGGGASDEEKALKVLSDSGSNHLINKVNKLTLEESAIAIQNSKGLFTGDTGLMHIASAFSVPIHTLWGNTHPDFGMYAYRPAGTNIYNHQVLLSCNPCSKLGSDYCPKGHFKCMNLQNVEQIVKNCSSTETVH